MCSSRVVRKGKGRGMNTSLNKLMLANGRSRRMLRATSNLSSKLQMALDIVIVEATLFFCIYIRDAHTLPVYYYPAIFTPFLMWVVYSNSGIYRRHKGTVSKLMSLSFAWSKVVVFLIVFAFMFKVSEDYSRIIIVMWFLLSLPLQVFGHIAVGAYLKRFRKREPIASLLVGNCKLGNYLAEKINANPWTAHTIIGVVSENCAEGEAENQNLPKLGNLEELRKVVIQHSIRRVYFALPMQTTHQIRALQLELVDLNVDIVWAPDIFGLHMVSPSVKEVAGIPLYYLSESPMVEGALLSKLMLDKIVSALALVTLSPIMLVAAIAVKLSSPGPVFYGQERHGLDGKVFRVLKFRSMKVHDEGEGVVSQAKKGDSRVTSVGAFLRRSSVDELPQIFNVLKGDMSLVGPRPHATSHNHFYADKINAYMSRHRIPPGMTGLAQVNGCRGETDTIEKMEKRVEYDLTYINNWSVWLDVRIMLKTVYTLFSKNAY